MEQKRGKSQRYGEKRGKKRRGKGGVRIEGDQLRNQARRR